MTMKSTPDQSAPPQTGLPGHVIIIGGGLGGLCLAQGLKKAGISVAVYERDRTPSDRLQGYRISINAQGGRALHACLPSDLFEVFLATCGKPGQGLRFLTSQMRELFFLRVSDPHTEPDPVESPKSVSRITLREILLTGLNEVVHFNKVFTHYEELPDGKIVASFEDGMHACGDVLVAADGGNSRVRQQFLPHARRVETGVDAIMGKVPLTLETRSLLIPGQLDGSTVVFAQEGRGMFVSLYEFSQQSDASMSTISGEHEQHKHHPDLPFDPAGNYLFWGLVARREAFAFAHDPQLLDGETLQSKALSMVHTWHPHLQQFVRQADPSTLLYTPLRTSLPLSPWESRQITLVGDAIHSMTPAQGIGGNTALRDAHLLCQKLIEVHQGEKALVQAIQEYEAEMRLYGFAAVRRSRQALNLIVARNVVARLLTRIVLRSLGMFSAWKRRKTKPGSSCVCNVNENDRTRRLDMLLITGATGTVGRELVQQLLDRGEQVRVFVRDPRKVADLGTRVECAVGDLNRLETLQEAMKGVRGVFLVTSATQQDRNVISAAQRNGVHIVKLSTIEAGHDHIVGHGKWHHEREELLRASGLPWTFLRPTMFASTALEWAATIRSEGAVYYPGGDGRIAPIDPSDIAAVAAVALTHPGHEQQAYALTGPELLSIRQMVSVLTSVLDKPLRYVDVPDAVAGEHMVKAGVPAYAAQGLVEVLEAVRLGECEDQTDTVERVIGRPPRTFEGWCRAHTGAFT